MKCIGKKITLVVTTCLIALGVVGMVCATNVYAEDKAPCDPKTESCQYNDPAVPDGKTSNTGCVGNECITKYVNPIIKTLSALVGVVATGSIVYAGIQYTMAAGESGKIAAAKKRIGQSIVAVIAWVLLLTFLQWILPGAVL